MTKSITLCLIASIVSLQLIAQHITYDFAAPNAIHHEAEITVTASGLKTTTAYFRMSRSSPGRYATHEFGKNVYNVVAYDASNNRLKVEKTEGDVYRISGHRGTIKVTYTLFANFADGTYSNIDVSGYHLNIPSAFMWVKGMEKAPITIHFFRPDSNWKIATQLKPTNNPNTFAAPDLQYFMDSPTKIGNLHIREWKETNTNNKQITFRLALEAEAPETTVDSFTEKLKRIVEQGKAVYGEFPNYDFGTYTFIASINPYVAKGDGMEHRNSTMITSKNVFDGSNRLLATFAHEFFHCWNVERIRPKSLEPFNFEKANMSEALWVAEGFTHYYGPLLMVRAGLLTYDQFQGENSKLVNAKINTPGAQLYTPIENSQRAVFVDAGVAFDRTNYPNMFTSYYTYGGALALALDLQLRSRFNKSLDDVMRQLWIKHGKTEIPYTLPDVQNAIANASGDKAFAADFFNRYVYAHEAIDYNELLAPANYNLTIANEGKAWIGNVDVEPTDNGMMIVSSTVKNTPLYSSGLDYEDVIEEMDGKKMTAVADIDNILTQHKPNDQMPIVYRHRNNYIKTVIVIKENPQVLISDKNEAVSEAQKSFRQKWMDAK